MQKLELKDLLSGFGNNQVSNSGDQEVVGSTATQEFLHGKSQRVE
jgi:hypothetical protein